MTLIIILQPIILPLYLKEFELGILRAN